jgi:hypothetical protein
MVRRALREWGRSIPESEDVSSERDRAALLAAFPFDEAKVDKQTTSEIADPIRGNEHPVNHWLHARDSTKAVMRLAHERGMEYLVELLEVERETIAQQAAFAVALADGEHPEVVEKAHRENLADAAWIRGEE